MLIYFVFCTFESYVVWSIKNKYKVAWAFVALLHVLQDHWSNLGYLEAILI